jgi:tripartite-type tricarboxylate transporter receptor subunit TctC
MGFNNVSTLYQNLQAGQVVALGVAEPKRIPELPNVPAVAETLPGFEMAPWAGIIVPARTPKDIVARLAQETTAVMRDPDVVKLLTEQQLTPYSLDASEFEKLIRQDHEKWATVIKTAGIKPE